MSQIDYYIERLKQTIDHDEINIFLMELGSSVKTTSDIRKEENLVRKCQSKIWIASRLESQGIIIDADCDSKYTLGMFKIIHEHITNTESAKIKQIGIRDFKDIIQYLPIQRQQGFQAMLNKIQSQIS